MAHPQGKQRNAKTTGDRLRYPRQDETTTETCHRHRFPGKREGLERLQRFRERKLDGRDKREKNQSNYPADALRELLLNACMHRDYQANMPTRFYQFANRIEIMNPGGLYGKARPENFPDVNDYRNPIIAQALKVMGYVNMFNRGVSRVKNMMVENGGVEPVFRACLNFKV